MLDEKIENAEFAKEVFSNPRAVFTKKRAQGWLKSQDSFGTSYGLNYNGASKFTTRLGGIFTLLLRVIVFFYFCDKISGWILRLHPKHSESVEMLPKDDKAPTFTAKELDFGLGVVILAENQNTEN